MTHSTLDVERLRSGSVLVVGDVMLDTFVYGQVSRISPEAPIPIVSVANERKMAGGAANVALNVAALGAHVAVVGLTGDDEAGRALQQLLSAEQHAVTANLVVDVQRPTSLKTRYVGNNQQILRVDRESTAPAVGAIEGALIRAFKAHLAAAQVVAISDYGKGVLTDRVLTEVIGLCRDASIPIVVDPKRARWEAYRGSTVIKPNLQELARATGIDCHRGADVDRAAAQIVDSLGAAILLTRSQDGMSLYEPGRKPVHARAAAHEVFDVSGAGDTALAAFAVSLASHHSQSDAMQIANVAAGVAVTKLGTAVVSADELARAWTGDLFANPTGRVMSPAAAAAVCHDWRARGLRIGFTNGCFDILHAGHVSMLTKAASQCDRLVVALNSDASVRRLKGSDRPVQDEASRAHVLAALQAASLVTVFEEDTPLELIKLLKPDMLFKGADYSVSQVIGGDLVRSWGGEVVLVELVPGRSTTSAIRRARGLV